MLVEMKPISNIHPRENNPRLNDAAVDAVAASRPHFRSPVNDMTHEEFETEIERLDRLAGNRERDQRPTVPEIG